MATAGSDRYLYSIAETAAALNLSRAYVYSALIQTEIIPTVRIGVRKRLVARRDLEAYVEKLRTEAGIRGEA